MSRLAWFSPLPPATSGIAAYSAELVPLLRDRGVAIDTFTDSNAHDFVWRHRRSPYDLTVFQMGNAECHDFMWAYLFRYPGLVVLHDAQLHQARALFLTKRWQPRRDDYLAEFRANHPEAPPDVAHLVAAGLGGRLYPHWPMTKLVIERARLVAVHNARLAADLRQRHAAARVEPIPMGVADVHDAPRPLSRDEICRRHAIPEDAMIVAAFGGVTPEKRIPQLLQALSSIAGTDARVHVMLVGASAAHYDVAGDARRHGLEERVHVTGYVPEAELPAYLLAADVCACLRWPTNRETSASWLRCLSAGRPTMITALADVGDVPTLDPRGWQTLSTATAPGEPVAVSVDLLDEDHSLQLALERLVTDERLRQQLGASARRWWEAHHQLAPMADAYERIIRLAQDLPVPDVALPTHLVDDGSSRARELARALGIENTVQDLLRS